MAAVFTAEAIARIEQMQLERTARLAAKAHHMDASPDPIHPGAWVVRNPRVPYRVFLVDQHGQCCCSHFATWDRCKHAALVATRKGQA